MTTKPYFERYENLDTHWFNCRTCGGNSMDSDLAYLAGKTELSSADVKHVANCPCKAYPCNHVRRVTRTH